MSVITIAQLADAMPDARAADLALYLEALNESMQRYAITTPVRIAAFLAQVGHESQDFRATEENLNYSATGLRATWPKRFATDAVAEAYARKPEKIANRAYALKNGNGDEASGDGWRFRGRGLIQVTGRANYLAYSVAIADPSVLDDPGRLARPPHAALSAGWYWAARGLNPLADVGDETSFNEITLRINGGFHGKDDRLKNWAETRAALVTGQA